jgi:hypothetical protein
VQTTGAEVGLDDHDDGRDEAGREQVGATPPAASTAAVESSDARERGIPAMTSSVSAVPSAATPSRYASPRSSVAPRADGKPSSATRTPSPAVANTATYAATPSRLTALTRPSQAAV